MARFECSLGIQYCLNFGRQSYNSFLIFPYHSICELMTRKHQLGKQVTLLAITAITPNYDSPPLYHKSINQPYWLVCYQLVLLCSHKPYLNGIFQCIGPSHTMILNTSHQISVYHKHCIHLWLQLWICVATQIMRAELIHCPLEYVAVSLKVYFSL